MERSTEMRSFLIAHRLPLVDRTYGQSDSRSQMACHVMQCNRSPDLIGLHCEFSAAGIRSVGDHSNGAKLPFLPELQGDSKNSGIERRVNAPSEVNHIRLMSFDDKPI